MYVQDQEPKLKEPVPCHPQASPLTMTPVPAMRNLQQLIWIRAPYFTEAKMMLPSPLTVLPILRAVAVIPMRTLYTAVRPCHFLPIPQPITALNRQQYVIHPSPALNPLLSRSSVRVPEFGSTQNLWWSGILATHIGEPTMCAPASRLQGEEGGSGYST